MYIQLVQSTSNKQMKEQTKAGQQNRNVFNGTKLCATACSPIKYSKNTQWPFVVVRTIPPGCHCDDSNNGNKPRVSPLCRPQTRNSQLVTHNDTNKSLYKFKVSNNRTRCAESCCSCPRWQSAHFGCAAWTTMFNKQQRQSCHNHYCM